MVRPSERASWDLSPNAFTSACRRRVAEGSPLFDLAQSNPTTIGIDYPADAILRALSNPAAMRYEPSSLGLAQAREQVAAWYQARGLSVRSEQVVLTASSSEAYAYLLKLLCNPGESILVPQPSYPLFDQLARLESVSILRYPLVADDRWRVDVGALRAAVRPNTRALFVVSPNNPTGSYLHADERDAIESVAREFNLAIVCDEVFAEYVWVEAEDRVRCAALNAAVPTFSLGGLSKSAGTPQMKLGWILVGGPTAECRELLERIEMIADTFLSVSAPVQYAAQALLDAAECVRVQLAQRILGNIERLRNTFGPSSLVTVPAIDAGWYVSLRVPSIMSDEAWAAMLVERDGVVVHPGSFFGFEREGTLVAGLIAPPDVFEEGIRRLNRRIAETCR